jgi:hypothetical protein
MDKMKDAVDIIADAFYNRNLDTKECDAEALRLVLALDRAGWKIMRKE